MYADSCRIFIKNCTVTLGHSELCNASNNCFINFSLGRLGLSFSTELCNCGLIVFIICVRFAEV